MSPNKKKLSFQQRIKNEGQGYLPGKPSQLDIFRQALMFHQSGNLSQAEVLYRKILQKDSSHVGALNHLGVLAYQMGKNEIAAELISKALALKPDYVSALINQGNVFKAQNKLDEAESSYRRAIALKPDFAEAHNNLGSIFENQGRLKEAITSYSRAIDLNPGFVVAYQNLGKVLRNIGDIDGAISNYRQAVSLNPNYPEAHFNLGNALKDRGNLEEAISSYRQVIVLQADFVLAHHNLGDTLMKQGKFAEAVSSYRQAIALKPDFIVSLHNLGNALALLDKLEEAVSSYRKVLALQPDFAEALYSLGNALAAMGRFDEAVLSYNQAINLKPEFILALMNLGNTLMEQGRLDEAVSTYRRAISLNPDYPETRSNLLLCLNYHPVYTQEEIYEESVKWGERLISLTNPLNDQHANSLMINRKLRIGYVSPDFRMHSIAFFIEPLIRTHNREKVEVFCYSNVKMPDEITVRLQAEADHWCDITGMDSVAIANLITKDKIDLLVDLAGHTRNNSLSVFAAKPSPVQITWLGYPNTTGLATMDYRLTDALADPPGETDRFYSEKLVRLEHGFLCYRPPEDIPDVGALPCLGRGHITFGSFNNLIKVTPEVIKTWSRILQGVPGARLLLKARQLLDSQNRIRLRKMFAREGIQEERLELHGWLLGQMDHLKLYSRIDIGLDPFPYNGTTTTCEALYMGVPVVVLTGDRHASRVGTAILNQAGLDNMTASSVKDYIQTAQALALDRERLQEMRINLRARLKQSELMNSQQFTSQLEEIYLEMWRRYCESKSISS